MPSPISRTVPVSHGSPGSRATQGSTAPLSMLGCCPLGTQVSCVALGRKFRFLLLSAMATIWCPARGLLAKGALQM